MKKAARQTMGAFVALLLIYPSLYMVVAVVSSK